MKKRIHKGFTLIEMIIVVAIFSIIMFSMVQLLDPVSKFFVRSSNFETTTACVDNMKRCIEGNLKYADRVRVYSGFKPYDYVNDSSGLHISTTPSADLQSHVADFYNIYFADRKFLDTAGTIYVLCFDNTVLASDATLASLSTLADFSNARLNTGKIVLYEFRFDNYNGISNAADVLATMTYNEWAVNQKLYGAFEYRYVLNAFTPASTGATTTVSTDVTTVTTDTTISTDATTVATLPGGALPPPRFNPQDCTITIVSSEIRTDKQTGGLVRQSTIGTNVASFSMKNVLDATQKNSVASFDHKTMCNGDESMAHVYYSEEIPRYANLISNPTNEFDGFYFIFTLPQTTSDCTNASFLNNQGTTLAGP